MPYNGSGAFSPPGASFPAVSGALIESAKFNNVINDLASGLSTAITKDGQTTVTADLPMSGQKHTGVGDATARTHYASAGQVQDSSLTWAGTAGGTGNAITLTLTPAISAYVAGQSFTYKSGASVNTGAMTVAVSGLATKAIQKNGVALASGDHPANSWFRITYDGTAFQLEQIVPTSSKADLASPTFTGTVTIPTVAISAGTITGITDLAIADGGTGASTAALAFAALKQAASTTATGVVELATSAEALAGTDTTRAVTSAGLASSQSLGTSGYIKLPGGLIVQWGTIDGGVDIVPGGMTLTATYPTAFAVETYRVIPTIFTADSGEARKVSVNWIAASTTQATFYVWEVSSLQTSWNVSYIAIGK